MAASKQRAVDRLIHEFTRARCRFCAGNVITSDGIYKARPDSDNRHWSCDNVDYWPCGLSATDRKLIAEARG